ncbi:MAG TPA: hypothetical protein VIE37_04270 [Methylomirabilota bacterium]
MTPWVRASRSVPAARRGVNTTVLEVAGEVGRALAAFAGLIVWGALLLLLAA